MGDGMTAGHRAARAAIKARRPDLPVGFSLAIVDDQVVRRRPEPAGPQARRGLRALARAGPRGRLRRRPELRAASTTTPSGAVNPDGTPAAGGPMSGRDPASLGCCARYAHEVTGVPVLVTEHGMQTDDDTERAAFIEPSLRGPARGDGRRRAGARLPPLDADGQLRVDLRLRRAARAALRRPGDVRAHRQAERRRVRGAGANGSTTGVDELSPVRFEHHREALGIGEAAPRLSWQVAAEPGWRQAAYELAIGDEVFRVASAGVGARALAGRAAAPPRGADRAGAGHRRGRVACRTGATPRSWSAAWTPAAGRPR